MRRDSKLLTETEHELVSMLGQCANLFAQVTTANGVQTANDRREFIAHIHDCQNAVMANAAARAFPDRYRLAGSALPDPHPEAE